MCKAELFDKECRIVKFYPIFAIWSDVWVINHIPWDEITSPNLLVHGRKLFSEFGGVGGIPQEGITLSLQRKGQEKLCRPSCASIVENIETFFERMFLWDLVDEVVGKGWNIHVLFGRRSKL